MTQHAPPASSVASAHPAPSVSSAPSVAELVADAEALLLDYNGTLSDDEELLAELVGVVARRELGVPVSRERYFAEFAGFTEEHMFGVLAAEAGVAQPTPTELLHVFNGLYLERTRENSTITAGARAFVEGARAAGKRLMVVTAASQEVVIPALEQAGLIDEFVGVIALEDVAEPKPRPEGYLRALESLGLEASRAVAFEDSRTGITAATAAGLTTVAVLGSLDEAALQTLTPHTVHALQPALLG